VQHGSPDELLTKGEVAKMVKVTQRALDRWIAAGSFPGPDLVMGNTLRWWRSSVVAWVRVSQCLRHPPAPKGNKKSE
jgi:predicted DNA-binding transcriptional regulator AlpA